MRNSAAYCPRKPEESVLYQVAAHHLETFIARQHQSGRPLPGFVEREFRSFLECGIAEFGFLRLHCYACGKDRILPFSCKSRGVCCSCGGRRMSDTAAHLVDRVIPDVPVRQWVLSVPYALRYRKAFDTELVGRLLKIFIRAIFASLRKRARDTGIPYVQCGAVTVIQRFGSSLNLHVHLHVLVFDGVYAAKKGERPQFCALRAPGRRDVVEVARRVAIRAAALLESADESSWEQGEHGLAAMTGASILGRIAEGPNAGQRVRTAGAEGKGSIERDDPETGHAHCAVVSGFNVHAGVHLRAGERGKLERLCRYMARPPLAADRLKQMPNGRPDLPTQDAVAGWHHTCDLRTAGTSGKTGRVDSIAAKEPDPVPWRSGACSEMADMDRAVSGV